MWPAKMPVVSGDDFEAEIKLGKEMKHLEHQPKPTIVPT